MTRATTADQLESRLGELRGSAGFTSYERARRQVLRLLDGAEDSSSYWREELDNLEYLLDASPLVVEKLRHHCFHVTGVRPYDYRSGQHILRGRIQRRLAALRAVDSKGVFVPESEVLGGFGFAIDGALVNLDTVKYYESLIALETSGVLRRLRAAGRPVICEIGGGWGGMAYQLKTLVPHATYVIVDLPELFLLSGTYLATAFPDATVAFWGDEIDWGSTDFVLVPNTAVDLCRPPAVDLGLNTVSFQEMTTRQVESYTTWLSDRGASTVYSLNRDRSVYNTELTSVREILSTSYDLSEVHVLHMPYNRLDVRPSPKERLARRLGRRENEYRHVVGRRHE